jgi:hypothetical protein
MLSVLRFFGVDARQHLPYLEHMYGRNNLVSFFQLLFVPHEFPSGTMYMGYFPVVLCVLSCIFYLKEMRVFVMALLLAIWLSFGPNAFFDFHRILWHIPVFNVIREFTRYYGLFIVFFISILAGKFFLAFEKLRKTRAIILSFALITLLFLNLALANFGYSNVYDTVLPDMRPEKNKTLSYAAILNGHMGDETVADPLSFFLYQKNIGLLTIHNPYRKKIYTVPKYFLIPKYVFLAPYTSFSVIPNPQYRGEAFFLNSQSRVISSEFRPNELFFEIETRSPDLLVINQNYDESWKASLGKLENHNGLLAIRFINPVRSAVRIVYYPRLFFIGLVISLVSVAGSGVYIFMYKRRNKEC